MVWEILATAPFGKEKKGEVGVERLVADGAYSAAFPLHDVSEPQCSKRTREAIYNSQLGKAPRFVCKILLRPQHTII